MTNVQMHVMCVLATQGRGLEGMLNKARGANTTLSEVTGRNILNGELLGNKLVKVITRDEMIDSGLASKVGNRPPKSVHSTAAAPQSPATIALIEMTFSHPLKEMKVVRRLATAAPEYRGLVWCGERLRECLYTSTVRITWGADALSLPLPIPPHYATTMR